MGIPDHHMGMLLKQPASSPSCRDPRKKKDKSDFNYWAIIPWRPSLKKILEVKTLES